jgi:hypothetical protein
MNILLAYVSYPATTAAYWERALRKVAQVKTIGPKLPERLLVDWKLENMKTPVVAHDISVVMDFDASSLDSLLDGFKPDLYLWVESVPGYFPKNLEQIRCPKACYLIDTYGSFSWHIEWAKNFDYVFLADLSFVERFRQAGMKAFWLPLGCDPEVHIPQTLEQQYDIGFVGTVVAGTDRQRYLNALASKYQVHYERSFLQEMSATFSKSKMVFNNAVGKTDLNMRFFEAMSCGTLLLSDMSHQSGQNILFEPHRDYALYDEKNIVQVAGYYLENDWARQSVAKRGQELVLAAHTYQHRIEHLLEVVGGKLDRTYTPYEWRDLAHSKVAQKAAQASHKPFAHLIDAKSIERSFIIPVLDYSPASIYNIKTLLNDLSSIGGEVIIIFNSEKVGAELKDHPRIDHYAILKENIGVARAWNMGLDLCRTDYAFILNADLHVTKEVIEQLQEALKSLPQAAIVGPQGSYFNFEALQDYLYLDKGTFNNIMEVDAVSGFLFGVKTKPFQEKKLQFENDYTPCYFEEWDLGLQIKAAELKSYVVPLKDYEHQWSGSIRSYRQIAYYDRAQTAKQIQMRNAVLFQEKWRQSKMAKENPSFLRSLWFPILVRQLEIALAHGHLDHAKNFLERLEQQFSQEPELNHCRAKFASQFSSRA